MQSSHSPAERWHRLGGIDPTAAARHLLQYLGVGPWKDQFGCVHSHSGTYERYEETTGFGGAPFLDPFGEIASICQYQLGQSSSIALLKTKGFRGMVLTLQVDGHRRKIVQIEKGKRWQKCNYQKLEPWQ